MKLMLDTHVLLWWLSDNPKLGRRARALIADLNNDLIVSVASPWEISVKHRIGKLDKSGAMIMQRLGDEKMGIVATTADHLAAYEALPKYHNDPFDLLILAQALVEGAIVITNDDAMRQYGVRCIDVA